MTEKTCAFCRHIGGHYWGDIDRQDHFCGKKDERRRDGRTSSGDAAQDFMDDFCRFYDASARQKACRYFEETDPLGAAEIALMERFDAKGVARFQFFSRENGEAERHPSRLFERDSYADERRSDGFYKGYRLTNVGRLRWEHHLASSTTQAAE
jgi:hypothetical protein